MLNTILGLSICFAIAAIIFYLALSKSKSITKPIKILAQFLLLPLYPYLKYGNSLKGIGGTMAIFCGMAVMLAIVIGLISGLLRYFVK